MVLSRIMFYLFQDCCRLSSHPLIIKLRPILLARQTAHGAYIRTLLIRAHNLVPTQNPVFTLHMALLSIILTVAHMIVYVYCGTITRFLVVFFWSLLKYTHKYTYTWTRAYTYIYIYYAIYTYLYIYIHIPRYIYIYMYAHTRMPGLGYPFGSLPYGAYRPADRPRGLCRPPRPGRSN